MLVYLFLILTLALALRSIALAWKTTTWSGVSLAVAMAVFIYLYGAWIYLSFYAKYVFAGTFLLAVIAGLLENRDPKRTGFKIRQFIWCDLFLLLIVLYFTGTTGSATSISLNFPLKHGDYFVLQGGKGLPANVFHFNSRRAVFAMDIVRLDDNGRRCRQVFSKKLDDYFIFGDTVYSPCNGVIGRAMSDNPDNIPPERKRGPHNLNGVLIEADTFFVFLGHLKQYGVFVKAGDTVKIGDPLGIVGNSGMSIEPHLHIQVHEKKPNGLPWYRQQQLFIQFGGKSYLLFQRIKAY